MTTNPDRTALILHGVDRTHLRQAGYILSNLFDQAPPGEARDRLQFLVRQVAALDRHISGRRISVPDHILDEMQKSAPDTWVASLLGWTRAEVRYRRQQRGIRPRPRGGVPRDYGVRQAEWTEEWTRRLQDLGLWPE